MTGDDLSARARALGVATSYADWAGRTIDVDPNVIAAVVERMGEPAPPPEHRDAQPPLPLPDRSWGWSVQVYALHSENSWGMGDFGDLRDLAVWSAEELGADLVLVNPLHAVVPIRPVINSPYSPTSRRFTNPLYLRIENIPEYRAAPATLRKKVDKHRIAPPDPAGLIDRDGVWDAKHAALQELWPRAREVAIGPDLRQFATFSALAEEHGLPWQNWPKKFRDPLSPAVAKAQTKLAERIAFHAWLQVLCAEQLEAVQVAARHAGMRIGVVHDLAVGVDPGGADAWALQDVLAADVSVGAPPDSFNQLGQNWALPPWRPDALAKADYAPYRAMLHAILEHGGGIRVDHVIGLSRLWWVPGGNTADKGTYVSYDADALLDVLVAEAQQRGAVVVGEDLGTVEARMRDALDSRGVLGSAVLWFEREGVNADGPLKPPWTWRERAMASISTHDLPTAHGFLAAEYVRIRHELGQLGRSVEEEQAQADADRASLLDSLQHNGLIGPDDRDNPDAVTLAMHRFLGRTTSRILLASPYDVIGELRQPNLPGTTDQYPNWRIPLPLRLAEFQADPRVAETARVLREPD